MINVEGLDKAAVLKALFDGTYNSYAAMKNSIADKFTEEDARTALKFTTHFKFNYLCGRIMEIDLSSDTEFDERIYDGHTYEGNAASIIERLKLSASKREIVKHNYDFIFAIVKDESITRSVLQTEAMFGIDCKDVLKSMGFKIE